MGIYAIKPKFQQALLVFERPLVRHQVHPDVITISALVISVLGGLALYASTWTHWTLLAIPFVALVRTALNALDGMVANDLGVARPWGEVLNEVSDRLSDVALFGGVAFAVGSHPGLGAVVIVGLLLSSYVGTVAKAAGGKRQYVGIMGKADRMIYLSVASLLAFALPSVPVLTYFLMAVIVGIMVTLAQRLGAAYADLKSLS